MPEFDAKNRKKDIREIYDRIPKEIRLMSEAVPYILAELGLAPSDESERIESHRVAIDLKNISNTLTERGYSNLEQTKEYDPKSTEIAKHVIGSLVRYPFYGTIESHRKKALLTKSRPKYSTKSRSITNLMICLDYMELLRNKVSYCAVVFRAFMTTTG